MPTSRRRASRSSDSSKSESLGHSMEIEDNMASEPQVVYVHDPYSFDGPYKIMLPPSSGPSRRTEIGVYSNDEHVAKTAGRSAEHSKFYSNPTTVLSHDAGFPQTSQVIFSSDHLPESQDPDAPALPPHQALHDLIKKAKLRVNDFFAQPPNH